MTTWEEAAEYARAQQDDDETEPAPVAASSPSLIVVDHFDIGMVDPSTRGVRLLVRAITRLEALSLVRDCRREKRFAVSALNERGQGLLERELQLEPVWRPKVTYGTRLLVVHLGRWNDIRWYLVEYESDGDGCIP